MVTKGTHLVMLALVMASSTALAENRLISNDLYHSILRNPTRTWTPIHPSENKFANWTEAEIRALMGTRLDRHQIDLGDAVLFRADPMTPLPKDFDSRTKFASCHQAIRDQKHCGSCWAFAAAETLSENLCISQGSDVTLSPQDLVSCDKTDHGCHGGTLPNAWKYLVSHGIVADSCLPYTSADGNVSKCTEGLCPNGGSWDLHRCPKSNFLSSAQDIKNGVLQMGSVETGFTVYSDFLHYQSGVYKHDPTTSKMPLGGHAVRIVGWGHAEIGGDYWLVANSWGPAWGLEGYFKISTNTSGYSDFAIGGGFNCGNLSPAPPAPTPPAPPDACKDILPSKDCEQRLQQCSIQHLVCKKTCGCCKEFDPPAYCNKTARF